MPVTLWIDSWVGMGEGMLRTYGIINCQTMKGPRVSREKFAVRAMVL